MGGQVIELCRKRLPLGVILVSEISRHLIAYFCMTANAIVEHLDIFKDNLPCLLTGEKAVMMQAFCFESPKEALHRGIVPVASFPAHRGFHAIADL